MDWNSLLFQTITRDHTFKPADAKALEDAATNLAGELRGHPPLIAEYAFLAFNPKHPAASLLNHKIEKYIVTEWSTFNSEYKDRPVAIIRMVMVLALIELSEDDNKNLACGIHLILTDLLARLQTPSELPLLQKTKEHLERKFQRHSEELWAQSSTKIPSVPSSPLKIALSPTTKQDLITGIRKSFNTGDQILLNSSAKFTNEWLSANAESLSTTIQDALNALLVSINQTLPSYLKTANTYSDAYMAALQKMEQQNKEFKVLWWLQVKYSPSLKKSYRTLSIWTAAAQMAVDFDQLIGQTAPEHVEAVLIEAMLSLFGKEAEQETSLMDALQHTQMPTPAPTEPLLLWSMLGKKPTKKHLETTTGLNEKTQVSPVALSLWLFRLLQGKRLL